MRPDDGWLIFGLGVTLGFVAGWLAHGVFLALVDIVRYSLTILRKLYGWHRARDAKRLADLEYKMAHLYADLR